MVYDAFKQVILIVVITVFCISNSTGQNKIKDFSTEYDVYLKELSDLMFSSDNSDLKSNFRSITCWPTLSVLILVTEKVTKISTEL